ncbi:hypothetical protein ETB97_009847 [Aspergillus alliaceus]|uniref:Uncharacterized protein n=1 Tax=Petromyces alliaceus TaxID=209559 RepID=A0A8H6E0I0_PETAA|nr:hypothetical protein ETB97_009847 [Aspergillus burnettii]
MACDELKRVQARKAIKTLQRLPHGLYSLYQKLFDTATAEFARRPLAIPELSEACELHPDDDEESRILFTKELIDSCGWIAIAQNGECVASVLKYCRPQMNVKNIGSEGVFLDYSVSLWPEHAGLAHVEFALKPELAAL